MADTELYDTLEVSKHSSDGDIKRVSSITGYRSITDYVPVVRITSCCQCADSRGGRVYVLGKV